MDASDKLKEYEILSEDRRRAIEIFLKGVVVCGAFLAILVKFLLDATTKSQVLLFGLSGIVVIVFWHGLIWRCRKHAYGLNEILNKVVKTLSFQPVISTNYIFNITWWAMVIVTVLWLILFFFMLFSSIGSGR